MQNYFKWFIIGVGALVVVLAVLLSLPITAFNYIPAPCILPAGFACLDASMSATGALAVNVLNYQNSPINITSYGCNSNNTASHMQIPNTYSGKLYVPIGGNATLISRCYSGSQPTNDLSQGYLFINYTETTTGVTHTAIGRFEIRNIIISPQPSTGVILTVVIVVATFVVIAYLSFRKRKRIVKHEK